MSSSLLLSLFFMLLGCASGPPSDQLDIKDLNDSDLKAVKALPFVSGRDFFSNAKSKNYGLLMDESLEIAVETKTLDSLPNDSLSQLSRSCHEGPRQRDFQKILDMNAKYRLWPSFWNTVGICFFHQGNPEMAKLFFNKALELKSSYSPAINNIGVLLSAEQKDQKALLAFEQALKESPSSKTPRLNMLGLYLEYGLTQKAQNILNSLSRNDPGDEILLAAQAALYLYKGQMKQAIRTYEKLDSRTISYPFVGLNYSYALAMNNELSKAKSVLSSTKDSDGPKARDYRNRIRQLVEGDR